MAMDLMSLARGFLADHIWDQILTNLSVEDMVNFGNSSETLRNIACRHMREKRFPESKEIYLRDKWTTENLKVTALPKVQIYRDKLPKLKYYHSIVDKRGMLLLTSHGVYRTGPTFDSVMSRKIPLESLGDLRRIRSNSDLIMVATYKYDKTLLSCSVLDRVTVNVLYEIEDMSSFFEIDDKIYVCIQSIAHVAIFEVKMDGLKYCWTDMNTCSRCFRPRTHVHRDSEAIVTACSTCSDLQKCKPGQETNPLWEAEVALETDLPLIVKSSHGLAVCRQASEAYAGFQTISIVELDSGKVQYKKNTRDIGVDIGGFHWLHVCTVSKDYIAVNCLEKSLLQQELTLIDRKSGLREIIEVPNHCIRIKATVIVCKHILLLVPECRTMGVKGDVLAIDLQRIPSIGNCRNVGVIMGSFFHVLPSHDGFIGTELKQEGGEAKMLITSFYLFRYPEFEKSEEEIRRYFFDEGSSILKVEQEDEEEQQPVAGAADDQGSLGRSWKRKTVLNGE